MKIITIQPANTTDGTYDVHQPVPYPFHIEVATGEVLRQEFWRGEPASIIGFQNDVDVQTVDLLWRDAVKEPQKMVGLFPVFSRDNGSMFNLTTPITSAGTSEVDDHEVP